MMGGRSCANMIDRKCRWIRSSDVTRVVCLGLSQEGDRELAMDVCKGVLLLYGGGI